MKSAHGAIFGVRHRLKFDDRQVEMFERPEMSRKKCNRKIWNVEPGFNPVAHAIAGACVITQENLDALQTRELSAVESITHGHGTLQDWRDLADVINVCETAARMGIGREALKSCQEAQDKLLEAAKRYEDTGKMGLTGDGIRALRDVIEYHHLQRQSISRSKYEEVIRKTAWRIRARAPEVVEI